jgi:hypothetical protein
MPIWVASAQADATSMLVGAGLPAPRLSGVCIQSPRPGPRIAASGYSGLLARTPCGLVAQVITVRNGLPEGNTELVDGERLDKMAGRTGAAPVDPLRERRCPLADDRNRWIGGTRGACERPSRRCCRLHEQHVGAAQLSGSRRDACRHRLIAKAGDHAHQYLPDHRVGVADHDSSHHQETRRLRQDLRRHTV